jgi:uncharacterized phiE125 gp8 family phage protein
MRYGLTLLVPPALEPVSLIEAKAHLRVDGDDEDALIAALIVAARQYVEAVCNLALLTQSWALTLAAFPRLIAVPRPPLQTVEEITYVDSAGVMQTLAADQYRLDTTRMPGWITPAYGVVWPCALPVTAAITVRFTAGYGDAPADVPQTLRQAMLLFIAERYERREASVDGLLSPVPLAVDALLWLHRIVEAV